MRKEVEHFFRCLLAICLFNLFAQSFIGLPVRSVFNLGEGGTEVSQGLMLAKEALLPLEPLCGPFWCLIFELFVYSEYYPLPCE
jgi:hypothetical protein